MKKPEEIIKEYFDNSDAWDSFSEYITYNAPSDVEEVVKELIVLAQKDAKK